MSRPTLVEVIRKALESRLLDLHTAAIGVVESYDSTTQKASVLLTTRRPLPNRDGGITHEELPVLPDVPIMFQRSGAYSITFPIVTGTPVLVVFTQLDSSGWLTTGSESNVSFLRSHGMVSAFAVPGVFSVGNEIAAAEENALVIDGSDIRLGDKAPTDFVALAAKVQAEMQILYDSITTATPKPGGLDGGLQFKTQLLVALDAANYPNSVAAANVKAK